MPGIEEKTAKLSDVARAAGVSQGTVSNVFNRPQIVREEVREHVRGVARKLGYHGPDPKGRLLRAGKVNAIGVATTNPLPHFFSDPYTRSVMLGISEAADAAGAGISLVSAVNEETLGWNIQNALVDGFILFCVEGGERLVRLTRERQLPFVALAFSSDDSTVPALAIDNRGASRDAARHLTALGHRRFAILAMPTRPGQQSGRIDDAALRTAIYTTTRDRIYGYFDGMKEAGIDTATVLVFETQNDETTVHAAMEQLFAGERPTAILAESDRAALIAIDWLAARGLSVPGHVSIIGFDGIPEGEKSTPPLTTIAQPMVAIGRRAVETILKGNAPLRQDFPLELVVRGSTAKPRG